MLIQYGEQTITSAQELLMRISRDDTSALAITRPYYPGFVRLTPMAEASAEITAASLVPKNALQGPSGPR